MKKLWLKLSDVLFFQEGPGVRKNQYTTHGVKLLNVANLVDGNIDLSTSSRYISKEEAFGKYKHFLCDVGDFIVASSGIKVEYLDRKMGFIDETMLPLCMNTSTIRFKVLDESQLNIRYFMYYVKSKHFKQQVEFYITGSAQLNYGPSHLRKMFVPIIDISEQLNIIEKLDKLQSIMDKYREKLRKYDELIKARFVEMFGDPLDKSRIKKKYIDCVDFNPKKSEIKNLLETMVSFVPMECVGTDGSFSVMRDGKIKEFYKGYTYFRDGDVLLAKITPCFENGKVAIAEHCTNGIGFGTTEFHVSRPIKGISNPYWIKYLLKEENLHNYATINMSGSAGQKRIQTPFFEKLEVYLPPIELQKQFADFVKQIDKSKFVELKQYKNRVEKINSPKY